MSIDVFELERAQDRELRAVEDAVQAAEWKCAEEPKADPAARAQQLADEALATMKAMARLCGEYWGYGIAGAIRDVPAAVGRLRRRLNHGAALIARALELAQAFAADAGRPLSSVDDLIAAKPHYQRLIEETMERWDLLQRRPGPLDREMIAASRAAVERGEGEDVADILARLETGGPLVKE
jgi:hypothetical protein